MLRYHPEKSIETWYREILGDEVKCDVCGKDTTFVESHFVFHVTCSLECRGILLSKKRSDNIKDRWVSGEHYEKCYTEERHKKSSETMIRKWNEDTEYRERSIEAKNTQEYKDKRSTISLEIWERPGFKEQMQENLDNFITRTRIAWKDPEYKIKMAQVQAARYVNNPELRSRYSKIAMKRVKDPNDFLGKSRTYRYKDYCLKSKYELYFATFLESNSIPWEYEIPFEYCKLDGTPSMYLVDFFLPSYNVYVEIKDKYWINEETYNKLESLMNKGLNAIILIGMEEIRLYCNSLIGE